MIFSRVRDDNENRDYMYETPLVHVILVALINPYFLQKAALNPKQILPVKGPWPLLAVPTHV